MQLNHSFTVPVDVATTWATFEDIAAVAECFPGAVVTAVTEEGFEGTCKVKLGPIALQYAGSGTFVERDAATGVIVLDAKGRDKRGNGTAGAHVTARLVEVTPAETRVDVVTDLQITGKPAQFGRGVMQDVSDKLLGQFVTCLESRVAVPATASVGASPIEAAAADEAGPAASGSATDPSAPPAAKPPGTPPPPPEDALNLAATVLPILVRSAWKPLAGGLGVLVVLRWLSRRRR